MSHIGFKVKVKDKCEAEREFMLCLDIISINNSTLSISGTVDADVARDA